MTYLEGQYQKSVVSSGIRAIESILVRIDGFERALTTFVQAGPLPVQVLWGSTQLLINVSVRSKSQNATQCVSRLGYQSQILITTRWQFVMKRC